jgi:hypothetical protein
MDRHIITSAWWFGLISLALCLVNPAAAQVDQQRAEAYFKEAVGRNFSWQCQKPS